MTRHIGVIRASFASLFALLAISRPCSAMDDVVKYELKIPPQSMSSALQSLARQTKLQIIFFSEATSGCEVTELSGRFTLGEALQKLLDGSALKYREINAKTIEVFYENKKYQTNYQSAGEMNMITQQSQKKGCQVAKAKPGSLKKLMGFSGVMMAAASAHATDVESKGSIEEVMVTATRYLSGSQTTPLSMTAISGDELEKQGVKSIIDVPNLAPNVYVQSGRSSSTTFFSIRGIANTDLSFGGTSPVAIYLDDVYQPSTFGNSLLMFDLERVEVLRGPQGTLFGKNSTGGAVAVFSRAPTFTDNGYMSLRLAGGDQSTRGIEGALNQTLIDGKLAMRVSFKLDDLGAYSKDAYLDRQYGQSNAQSGRLQLLLTPDEKTDINLLVSAFNRNGDASAYHEQYVSPCASATARPYICVGTTPRPTPAVDDKSVALSDLNTYENFDAVNTTLRINRAFEGFTLTSISNYKRGSYNSAYDADGGPGDFLGIYTKNKNRQYGEELRIASDAQKPLSGLVGLYYLHDQLDARIAYASVSNGPPLDYNQLAFPVTKTRTLAAFASGTYKVTDELSFTGGLRKSDERRKTDGLTYFFFPGGTYDWTQNNIFFDGAPPIAPTTSVPSDPSTRYHQEVSSKPWTWDFTVNYRPLTDVMFYARAARGFRSGGFSVPPFLSARLPPTYKPERVQSYELGMKSEFFDHTLRINAALFHYGYHDQQVTAIAPGGLLTTTNAGTSKGDGAELEITALPIRSLQLRGSVGYVRAKYTDYVSGSTVFTGNTLTQAPKITANASLDYSWDISSESVLRASTSWSYRSKVFFNPNNDPQNASPGVTNGKVRLTLAPYDGKGLSLSGFVDNVTNKRSVSYATAFLPAYYAKTYTVGAVYGLDLNYAW